MGSLRSPSPRKVAQVAAHVTRVIERVPVEIVENRAIKAMEPLRHSKKFFMLTSRVRKKIFAALAALERGPRAAEAAINRIVSSSTTMMYFLHRVCKSYSVNITYHVRITWCSHEFSGCSGAAISAIQKVKKGFPGYYAMS